ncbi:MAG: hypothetical protein ACOYNC_04385 [Bacteroidales bacterium]
MKYFLLIIIVFVVFIGNAQNYSGSFNFRKQLYFVKSECLASGEFRITLAESEANKVDFTIKPLKYDLFKTAFNTKMLTLLGSGAPAIATDEESTSKSIFYNIVVESLKESMSDAPISGKLTIASSVNLYKDPNKCGQKAESNQVLIKDVEIEFNEGYIETIKVVGEVNINGSKRDILFENIIGIGFSTRKNFKKLDQMGLFANSSVDKYHIMAGELLNYNYKVRPMTRDFSPGNQLVTSFGGESFDLHKDETSKLFEAIVYSDFLGIDKDKPNGLIQIEVAKRINLKSSRIENGIFLSWLTKGSGWLQYIKPAVTISKIEENNRFLLPTKSDSIVKSSAGADSLVIGNIVSPIKILEYQNLSLGLDLNILFEENSNLKYHFYLNGGFRFGRTAIRDSLRTLNAQGKIASSGFVNEYNINYFTFYPEAILQFLPEERFSILISDRLQYFLPAFGLPTLKTLDKSLGYDPKPAKWINSIEIMAFVKTGQNGKIFARWRFTSQLDNIQQNYNQVQVGYSFYILKKN